LPGTNIAGYGQPPAADKTMTPWTTCKEQGGTRDKFPAPAPPAHATRRPLRSPHANPPPPPAHPLHPASSTTPSSRLPPWAGTTQRSRSSGEACAARLAVREPSGSIVQGVRAPPSPAPPGRATAPHRSPPPLQPRRPPSSSRPPPQPPQPGLSTWRAPSRRRARATVAARSRGFFSPA
jgi:hypothetical protein